MKKTLLLTFATSALLTASSAFAGGRCHGNCPGHDRDLTPDEGALEVIQDEAMQEGERPRRDGADRERRGPRGEGAEGERPERPERGERGERGQRGGQRGAGMVRMLLRGTEPSEEQQEAIREVMTSTMEAGREIMQVARAAHEEGEEVDRDAIRTQLQALQEAVPGQVRDLLTQEQQATFDANLAQHEERMAEREARRAEAREGRDGEEGEEGDRPRRRRGGEGEEGERPRRPRGEEGERPRRPRGGDRPDELELG